MWRCSTSQDGVADAPFTGMTGDVDLAHASG
jgi:hypothetical protein